MPIHRGHPKPNVEDILDMMFTVVPTYRVSHNRFVLEAARFPRSLSSKRRADLVNYVPNSAHPDELIPLEPYDEKVVQRLSAVVSHALGIEDDWREP